MPARWTGTHRDILTPMDVRVESTPNYIFATLTGDHSLEEVLKAFHEAYEAAFSRSTGLVLIDCSRLDGELTTVERFQLGESGAAYWTNKSWNIMPKIAVVGNAPVIDGFAAIVASNRGVEAQTFLEIRQALEWLGVR
jgi:hypothetical protein